MESFTVRTTLDLSDWNGLLRACAERARQHRKAQSLLVRVMPASLWVLLVAGIVVAVESDPPLIDMRSAAIAAVVFGLLVWALAWIQRRAYVPDERGAFVGTTTFEFDAAGFTVTRAHSQARNAWALVKEVTHTPAHIFLWIDNVSAYCLRVRDLTVQMSAEDAVARLRAFISGAGAMQPAGAGPAGTPADTAWIAPAGQVSTASPVMPSVWRELAAVLRLETRGSADAAHLFGRDLTISLLGALTLALWIGLTRLEFRGEGVRFAWWSLPQVTVFVACALLLAWLLARVCRPQVAFRRTLLLVAGFSPLIAIVAAFVDQLPRGVSFAIIAAVILWGFGYVSAGLRALSGVRQWRATLGGLVLAWAFAWVNANYLFAAGPWFQPEDEYGDSADERVDYEQLAFEQPARIDAMIARMTATPAVDPVVYFVGFAGYGDQRVFAEEIATAAKVVGERYDSTPRELRLINDRRDVEKYPFASTPALRHALLAVGERMNREKDVLFLALSSHGSEDATLSVTSGAGYWADLGADELSAMLDESGIRWRVIVISACHAGSFIDSLKDDHTIVLTAAAKERTSFGCSDDRDLTYFGEAFYRDALPKAADLRTAFETARAAIAEREKAEGIGASDPQAWFGTAMESKLSQMGAATSR